MANLSEARQSHIETLARDLELIKAKLSLMPEVHRIILFGSYARGRRDLFTDLDIMVIMDSNLDFVERCAKMVTILPASGPVDLLVYTPDEFDRIRERPFFRKALSECKVVYERRSVT
jgi:uncharacterized protein